jgi:hypothetical protein
MMQMTSAIIQIEGENRKRDLKSCSQADEKLDAVCEMVRVTIYILLMLHTFII